MPNKREERREAARTAAVGAGAVGAGTGLAAGGVPGGKSNFTTVLNPAVQPSRGGGKRKGPVGPGSGVDGARKGDSRLKARANLTRATPGGILGFRAHAHQGGLYDFDQKAKAAGSPADAKDAFYRGHNAGKIAPEKEILRGMMRGKKASNALLIGGAATTAVGLKRSNELSKRDTRSDQYHGALLGTGAAGAAATHGASKFLGKQERRYAGRAAKNVDEAGKLVPSIAGREYKKRSLRQMHRDTVRNNGVDPKPKNMYPKVKDGDIGRNPDLLRGVPKETAEQAGRLRGAAAQERHFAEVFGNTSKVVRRFRTPSAIVAGAGAGGLAVTHRDKIKKSGRLMSDAELRRRKKLQGKISQTTSTLGLAGVGVGTAAALASKKKGALQAIQRLPKAKGVTANGLKDAGLYTSLASGGIGGVGGYNFAAYTNAESRKRDKTIKKNSATSAFGVDHS